MKMNLVDIFCDISEKQPDHPAVIGPGKDEMYSYHRLREVIESMAGELKAAGIRPGTCVGLHYKSSPMYIILTYAIWRCGACLVPEEKHRIIREICLEIIITSLETANVVEPFQKGESRIVFRNIVVAPVKKFREQPSEFSDINAAFLRFTSGTTGISKGVVLSHESIYDRIHAANRSLHIGPEDRIIWLLSMAYHFTVSIVSYLSFGATIVLCSDHLGFTIIQTTALQKGSIIYGSPLHYAMMAHDRSSLMMPSLRLAISTATALRHEISKKFYNRFSMSLTEAYGIIEVGLPCINFDKPVEKSDSVGQVLPAYEIKMEDTGLAGGLREIKLRGKGFLDAYYDPWQTRNEIMPDGWFSTGDLGVLDDEGYLFILGRSKEMINVGGMKLFPQEVESVLESHPRVKEACVFSQQHKRFGEVPYAYVVMFETDGDTPSEKELKDYCKQHVAPFKIPDKILFVNALPRTDSGKLIRQSQELQGKEIIDESNK
jgi:long-chain acyl-CoA synthetase